MISEYDKMELSFWWNSYEDFQRDRIRIGGRINAIKRSNTIPEPEVMEEMNNLHDSMREGEEMCAEHGTEVIEDLDIWRCWFAGVNGVAGRLVGPLLVQTMCGSECRWKNGRFEKFHVQKPRKWIPCKFGDWCGGTREIQRFKHVSNFWSYAGLAPGQRRVRGKKSVWNADLKRQTWLIYKQFVKTKGSAYRKLYDILKRNLAARRNAQGYKIIPSAQLPEDDEGKKYEPEGIMSEGHLEGDVARRLRKIFLAHVFDVWRYLNGLPQEPRYAKRFDISEDYIPPLVDSVKKLDDKGLYDQGVIKKPDEVF